MKILAGFCIMMICTSVLSIYEKTNGHSFVEVLNYETGETKQYITNHGFVLLDSDTYVVINEN